jgi:pyochelin biosynthesis protein PchC
MESETDVTGVRDDRWVRRFHASPEAPIRLMCFPHAGGAASYFFPVSAALQPRIEVLALQYPGRQDRRAERCIDTIGELADGIYEAIGPWCDGPVAFFGHSMGAILAYEVARRMEEQDGAPPAALIVSGRRGPATRRVETVHLRGDDGIVAELQNLSGTSAQLLTDDDFVRMILPAMRSDYTAIETYRYEPGPPLSCPILALTGGEDPKATVAEVREWAGHTGRDFQLRVFPGGHFYLNDRPAEVITAISGYLESLMPAERG